MILIHDGIHLYHYSPGAQGSLHEDPSYIKTKALLDQCDKTTSLASDLATGLEGHKPHGQAACLYLLPTALNIIALEKVNPAWQRLRYILSQKAEHNLSQSLGQPYPLLGYWTDHQWHLCYASGQEQWQLFTLPNHQVFVLKFERLMLGSMPLKSIKQWVESEVLAAKDKNHWPALSSSRKLSQRYLFTALDTWKITLVIFALIAFSFAIGLASYLWIQYGNIQPLQAKKSFEFHPAFSDDPLALELQDMRLRLKATNSMAVIHESLSQKYRQLSEVNLQKINIIQLKFSDQSLLLEGVVSNPQDIYQLASQLQKFSGLVTLKSYVLIEGTGYAFVMEWNDES